MSSGLDKNDIAKNISKVKTLSELESIRIYYLGKKGIITSEMKSLSSFSNEQKKERDDFLSRSFFVDPLQVAARRPYYFEITKSASIAFVIAFSISSR